MLPAGPGHPFLLSGALRSGTDSPAGATKSRGLAVRLCEPVIESVAGTTNGPDRILLAAGIEQFAQATDMHIDRALVDVDVASPDDVELARG